MASCALVCVALIVINVPGFLFEEDDDPLLFLPNQDRRNLFVNNSFVITCYAREGISAVRIAWRGPVDEITEKIGRVHVEESNSKKGGMDLFFEGISTKDQGQYECSAVVDNMTVKRTFHLFVFRQISYVNTPDVQFAQEGTDQLIRCEASGNPEPTMYWRVNTKALSVSNAKYTVKQDGVLVHNVTREDGGDYLCRASQTSSEIADFRDKNIRVVVQYKPEWRSGLAESAYSFLTGLVNLTCEADAEPAPNFAWMKDGMSLVTHDLMRVLNERNKTTLEVRVMNYSDFGLYTCVASNELNSIEHKILLKEGAKPTDKPVVEVIHSDPDRVHLTIVATADDDDDIKLDVTGFRVELRTDRENWGDETVVIKEFLVDPQDKEFVIEELEHDTKYMLRVATRNAVGVGPFTADVVHRTPKMRASPVREGYGAGSAAVLASVGLTVASMVFGFFTL